MPSPSSPLSVLGLRPLEAQVLEVVVRQEQTTAAGIASELAADRSAVSAALERLQSLQLVDRIRGRRPAPVFVHDQVAVSAGALLEAADADLNGREERLASECAALEDARENLTGPEGVLTAAAMRRQQRGRPAMDLQVTDPWDGGRVIERMGVTSHDQVLPLLMPGRHLALRCPARILVVPGCDLAPEDLSGLKPGTEVRMAASAHPALLILDRSRVGVQASGTYGLQTVWSPDPRHVAAAEELFALWWAAAEPRVVVPQPVWDEPDYDDVY